MKSRKNQKGFIVSTELMLIATILVIGLIVGLQAVRTAVITELADVGGAIGSTSQTYSFSGVAGHHASTNGSMFQDAADTCDDLAGTNTQQGLTSRCVAICGADSGQQDPVGEGNGTPLPPTTGN